MQSGLNKPDDAKSVGVELNTNHPSCVESKSEKPKAPALSSTAVIIRQSSEQTKVDETIIDSILALPLLSVITDYLDESHPYQERYLCTSSFIANLLRIYERAIVHNLLWHIDIDENLAKVKIYQGLLSKVFNIKDPYGLEIEATLLQIMKAAGDRDTRKMKEGEKHFGIFELLVELFKELEMQDECKRQDESWSLDEEASAETMKPYVAAIETFCQQVIKNEDRKIPDAKEKLDDEAYEKLLMELPIAQDFEKAFKKPRPGYVVKSGFLSIIGLYLKFLEIRKKHLSQLGHRSHKDDVFSGKFFLEYQSMLPRCDLEIMYKELYEVTVNGAIPAHINFSDNIQLPHKHTFIFGFLGQRAFLDILSVRRPRRGFPPHPPFSVTSKLRRCLDRLSPSPWEALQNLYQTKTLAVDYAAPASSPADRSSDKVMLESKSVAKTAGR